MAKMHNFTIRPLVLAVLFFILFLGGKSVLGQPQQDSTKNKPSKFAKRAQQMIGKVAEKSRTKYEDERVALKRVSDSGTAEKITAVLPTILEKQLVGSDTSARKYVFLKADLNADGKEEIFVGFTGMNWCGSGGCTALILSEEGKLITSFTVADFPFIILDQETKGWKDLVVRSGGTDRLLQWNGKTYPSNPSVATKFKDTYPDNVFKALDFIEQPYPWFHF